MTTSSKYTYHGVNIEERYNTLRALVAEYSALTVNNHPLFDELKRMLLSLPQYKDILNVQVFGKIIKESGDCIRRIDNLASWVTDDEAIIAASLNVEWYKLYSTYNFLWR